MLNSKFKICVLRLASCVLCLSIISCHRSNTAEQQGKNTNTQKDILSGNNSSFKNQPKYEIKSAIITFEINIAGNKGMKMLYFDDYGKLEKEVFYDGETPREGFVTTGGISYRLIYNQKTAYKLGPAKYGNAFKFDWDAVPEAEKKAGHAIKSENVKIAGKNCESYKIDNAGIITKFAGWQGICLYALQQSKIGDAVTQAVKIQENIPIPPETFRIPSGFIIK